MAPTQGSSKKELHEYSKNPDTLRARARIARLKKDRPYDLGVERALANDRKAISVKFNAHAKSQRFQEAPKAQKQKQLYAIAKMVMDSRRANKKDYDSKVAELNRQYNVDGSAPATNQASRRAVLPLAAMVHKLTSEELHPNSVENVSQGTPTLTPDVHTAAGTYNSARTEAAAAEPMAITPTSSDASTDIHDLGGAIKAIDALNQKMQEMELETQTLREQLNSLSIQDTAHQHQHQTQHQTQTQTQMQMQMQAQPYYQAQFAMAPAFGHPNAHSFGQHNYHYHHYQYQDHDAQGYQYPELEQNEGGHNYAENRAAFLQ